MEALLVLCHLSNNCVHRLNNILLEQTQRRLCNSDRQSPVETIHLL